MWMHSLDPLDRFFSSFACCATCHNVEAVLTADEMEAGRHVVVVDGGGDENESLVRKEIELLPLKVVVHDVVKS